MKLNRVSLNVVGLNRIGLNRIGSPSRGSSSGSDRSYIDPEVLASLKAVVIVGNKTNNDSDRAIVKNLVDPDNPFVISNAAYTEGSGYADKDSPYYGAFVTDGIDDLITSTKTVQEMLGGSNEITVVSMAHFIKGESNAPEICRINQIRRDTRSIRNSISKIGKSGIFGYTYKNGVTTINNILGDKNDCTAEGNLDGIVAPFSVEGYYYNNNSNPLELCSIAWYWTIIANKVLITDQINQVIAYFNLDRTLKPDILCNVKKQGITNENHAEFGDRLIDFSGNGRDIQLNNIAWKGDSGIGKYAVDFLDSSIWTSSNSTITSSKIDCKNAISHIMLLYYNVGDKEYPDIPSFKIIKTGADIDYSYIDETGSPKSVKIVDGVNVLPASHNTLYSGSGRFCGFSNPGIGNSVIITQIPSHAGALCLDGVNDFGKVTGMPIYKDYTVVTDREIFANIGAILSKNNPGAFVETAENSVYSFGQATSGLNFISTRSISYLSKYSYCGQSITAGAAEDGTDMWLGTIRDNDSRFFNGAIYSLMSFPYSMSKFLIERQLKKHKLGTLYPDMVEFRPIVKSNSEYSTIGYLDYSHNLANIKVGDYVGIGDTVAIRVILNSTIDEVVNCKVNGQECEVVNVSPRVFDCKFTITSKSPQKINITIDEYIRYEDIVQPYPVLLRFNDENGNEVSWGGKFRVGSTITRIGSIDDTENNLLNGLYSTNGLTLNGKAVTSSTSIVEKQMVFKTTATYLLDNNEPKCIISPRLLRIPNSSYKILGYIPDISGHGNHLKINNSAYAGMSGANGYLVDFTSWFSATGIDKTDNKITLNSNYNLEESFVCWVGANSVVVPTFKVHITGIPNGGTMIFNRNSDIVNLVNGENTIEGFTTVKYSGFKRDKGRDLDWSNLVIQQIGEYEGAYCLDGVDDFVTIPTLSSGGKQVLMKVNWQNDYNVPGYMYDSNTGEYRNYIIKGNKEQIAYENASKTYIDGIRNSNITSSDLKDITHNITSQFNGTSGTSYIGCRYSLENFLKMALYDFMLFDEISTDDKIKELNEYVGIEAKVELPPYYWDAYGKTNLDADKATIQQRGVAVGDYDLTNHNHAYEGMSGYNGYPVVFGANKTWDQMPTGTFTWNIEDNKLHITKALIAGNGLLFSYVKLNGSLLNVKEIPSFKIKVSGLEGKSKLWYRYLKTEDAISETIAFLENGIHELPKSYTPSDSLHDGVWVGFTVSPISEGIKEFDCDITIEVLPEYENGLVYDGVEDYSVNTNIPALTDYTYICKRTILNIPINGATLLKGAHKTNGGAFIADYNNKWQFNFGQYNIIQSIPDGINWQTSSSFNGTSINRGTNTDDKGITIGRFSNGYANMVLYKLILYPKTIPLLQINFLKNLMERDEIIDLNNPIFKQNN